jgi:hypothetical protein
VTQKIKLGEQIAAIGVARRVLTGIEKAPAQERQRRYIADCLDATETILSIMRGHEQESRAFLAALVERGAQK